MLNLLIDMTILRNVSLHPRLSIFNEYGGLYDVVPNCCESINVPRYTTAYKTAILKILRLVTNIHPEFGHGKHILGWILGYSQV
jgi:hypothetical protein